MNCDSCGRELVVGEWPWCPHGFARGHIAANGFPFTTTHITGKPIEVTSEGHLKALCQAHVVTHRPDVAWLEKQHLGSDRTGKPIYREGSGMGLPGVWI